jgi:catalase
MRSAYELHEDDSDFIQPGNFYRNVLSPMERERLVNNIVDHMGQDVDRHVQEQALTLWRQVDWDLGERVARGLGLASMAKISPE